MIHHVRPYQILSLTDGLVTLPIPPRRGSQSGAPSLLETFLLIASARIVDARSIFEFGTCRGTTALNLAMNTDAQVYTLDLDYQIPDRGSSEEHYTELALANRNKLDFIGTKWDARVTVLRGNSRKFNYFPYLNKMDLVFVDGGHDYETVKSDTEAAFEMVQGRDVACIAWHDYREPLHSGITFLLDEMGERGTELFHVEDTVLCLWFSGGVGRRILDAKGK